MPINAKFQADFSDFLSAVDKAEIALVDFSKGANKVETTLNRMTDSFSGRKIIQEAGLLSVAIGNAGGTSKLTADELERVGRIANEAADKMKRLGYEVPAGIQNLADATKSAGTNTETWLQSLGVARQALSALGISVGIGAIIAFGKSIAEDADTLQRLADRTDIGVESLQRMRIAGDDAGVSLESMAVASNKLQKNLAEGSPNTVKAIEDLGLNMQAIRAMNADERLLAISDAIKQMNDPLRIAGDLSELFGKNWAEQLPVLKRGFQEVRDGVQVMSQDGVQFWDALGDAAKRNSREISAIFGDLFVKAFGGFGAADRDAKRDADELTKSLQKMLEQASKTAPTLGAMIPPGIPTQFKEIGEAIDADTKAADQFRKIMEEIGKTTFQMAMQNEKQWREELAKGLAERNKLVVEGLGKTKKAEQDLADFIAQESLSTKDYQIKQINDWVDAQLAAWDETMGDFTRFEAAIIGLADERKKHLIGNAQEEAAAQAKAFTDAALAEAQAQDAVNAELGKTPAAVDGADRAMRRFVGGTISLGITNLDELNKALKEFYDQFVGNAGSVGTPGPQAIPAPNVGGNMPRFRALGGLVQANQPFIVGEKGPELFVPKQSGTILPNGAASGAMQVTVNVTQPFGTPDAIGRAVSDALTQRMRSLGQRLPT